MLSYLWLETKTKKIYEEFKSSLLSQYSGKISPSANA